MIPADYMEAVKAQLGQHDAAILASYRDSLTGAGFTREEAQELVVEYASAAAIAERDS